MSTEQTNSDENSLILSSQNVAINCTKISLLGDENCNDLRDKSHLSKRACTNESLTIPRYNEQFGRFLSNLNIEVFEITNPRFNEQILLVPSDFVKSTEEET